MNKKKNFETQNDSHNFIKQYFNKSNNVFLYQVLFHSERLINDHNYADLLIIAKMPFKVNWLNRFFTKANCELVGLPKQIKFKAVTRLQDINVLNNICDDFSNFYCIIAINSDENITVPNDRIDWWCEANLVNFAGLKLAYTDWQNRNAAINNQSIPNWQIEFDKQIETLQKENIDENNIQTMYQKVISLNQQLEHQEKQIKIRRQNLQKIQNNINAFSELKQALIQDKIDKATHQANVLQKEKDKWSNFCNLLIKTPQKAIETKVNTNVTAKNKNVLDINTDMSYTKPKAIIINDNKHVISNWWQVIIELLKYFDQDDNLKTLKKDKTLRRLFCIDSNGNINPKKDSALHFLPNGVVINTTYSANDTIQLCKTIIKDLHSNASIELEY